MGQWYGLLDLIWLFDLMRMYYHLIDSFSLARSWICYQDLQEDWEARWSWLPVWHCEGWFRMIWQLIVWIYLFRYLFVISNWFVYSVFGLFVVSLVRIKRVKQRSSFTSIGRSTFWPWKTACCMSARSSMAQSRRRFRWLDANSKIWRYCWL